MVAYDYSYYKCFLKFFLQDKEVATWFCRNGNIFENTADVLTEHSLVETVCFALFPSSISAVRNTIVHFGRH